MKEDKLDLFFRPEPFRFLEDWIIYTRPASFNQVRMANAVDMDQDTDGWIRFIPNFNWTVWAIYSAAVLFILAFLAAFFLLHHTSHDLQKHLLRLMQMLLNNQYSMQNKRNISLTIYSITVMIGLWLFNGIFLIVIITQYFNYIYYNIILLYIVNNY